MRKLLGVLAIFLSFLIIYFIQANFFSWFNIAGIKPNLFLILAVVLGIFLGKYYGFGIGAIIGIFLDIFISQKIGINAIALSICGLLSGEFTRITTEKSRIAIILILIGMTFLSNLIIYILRIMLLNTRDRSIFVFKNSNFRNIVQFNFSYNNISIIKNIW